MATLNFRSKSYIKNHHLTVKYHELLADNTASLNPNPNLNDNLILHGDNLVALKSLLPIYAGKVKCIYIDPPYNTGNEGWRYSDNVNSPIIRRWLHDNRPVDREDETRHDKWLCMMMPRLYLLRELLRDDGVIFISIDDNELHHLRMLLDEVFGEVNWLGTITWKKKTNGNNMGYIPPLHEYIVAFAKSIEQVKLNELPLGEEYIETNFANPDNDPLGEWTTTDLSANHKGPYFKIINPNTGKEFYPPKGRYWVFNEEDALEKIKQGRIIFGKKGLTAPIQKKYKFKMSLTVKAESLWDDVGYNSEGTEAIATIFGPKEFENPKPVSLILKILKIGMNSDDIVLDSFAGSGTTGQAVLELNREDGGNRRFILVEMEDYADSLTAERLRRVIRGVPGAKDEKLQKGLGGTFSFFRLGSALDTEGILSGERLPTYLEMARYLFYTATAEQFDPALVREADNFIGESSHYVLYLIYEPKVEFLKTAALTLDFARSLPPSPGKKRVVFAPAKYLDNEYLEELNLEYAQLPYEIFRFQT